ncbi:CPCC family cysteine-rich protein [Streptomyces sp. NRRL B-24484]|uniref:CPCC family cysteine-rich protein n=1 Tax=Streptomyces sp. NRRL B-24484 TaxID=1463833 RepID=UPI001F463653|nr:CPCC family cysteine-rich protein [Streptomyces sp. NRRL B-24484]
MALPIRQDAAMVTPFVNIYGKPQDGPYRCPCCGFVTLGERGGYEICSVCFWEDDGQDDHDASRVRGGPNGRLSLAEARRNFHAVGACEERFVGSVRDPRPDECPPGLTAT